MIGYLRRLGIVVMLIGVAGLFVLTAFGLFCAAAYLALLQVMSPVLAAVTLGGVLLALGAIVLLSALLLQSGGGARTGSHRPANADPLAGALGSELEQLLAQAAPWIKSHQVAAALTAIGVGLAVGISPALRQMLEKLLAGSAGDKS